MRTELYFRKSASLAAAEKFAASNNGTVKGYTSLDHNSKVDFEDDEMQNTHWSGEVSAILVRDKDTYKKIGTFGYWDDKL